MQIHRALDQLPAFKNAVVTIGTFDGVHKGHQQIIAQMKSEAVTVQGETVILTFHPHPRMIVGGKPPVHLLTTLEEKIFLLAAQHIDHLVVIPFTPTFSQMTAEEYVAKFLVHHFRPKTIIIGYDHRFGRDRTGDFRLLEQMGESFLFAVKEIPGQVLHEIAISSTRIRQALEQGDPLLANELLGYRYFFEGLVVKGQQLGRTIGFPTANIQVFNDDKLIPGNGVYAVWVQVANQPLHHKGMMNIGIRPTVGGTQRVIEVHLLEYNENLYDQRLTIHLAGYLRAEQKFNGLESLKAQLAIDKQRSLYLLSK